MKRKTGNRMTRSWIRGLEFGLCLFIVVPASSLTQITFQRTYGSTRDDWCLSVHETSDGGYIMGGGSYSYGTGLGDVYLIKTDSLGDTLWVRTYGGTDYDWGSFVQQTSDSGYIITGATSSFGAGENDVYLIKTDMNGDTLWTRTHGGAGYDVGASVQQTWDGGYVIAGETRSFGSGGQDFYLIKTDANGDTLWTRTYGGTGRDYAFCVQATSDSGYIVVGGTTSFGAGWRDLYLVKTDANGDTLWTRTYGGTEGEYHGFVQETSDGGYILTGTSYSFGAVDEGDVYLVKTDANGDTLWTRAYGGPENDESYCVQATSDGGYVVVGSTASLGVGLYDVYLIKTDANGDTFWTKTYGGVYSDYGLFVQETSDSGFVLAGGTASFGASLYDVYLIKTDPEGGVQVKEQEKESAGQPCLAQNSPNPFNRSTVIRYRLSRPSSHTLRVYDVSGRLVRTLLDGQFAVGNSESPMVITWDGRDDRGRQVSCGTYLYRLSSDSFDETRRMILVR